MNTKLEDEKKYEHSKLLQLNKCLQTEQKRFSFQILEKSGIRNKNSHEN